MTAMTPSLTGFRPFLRKEVGEWWQRRAALTTLLVVAAMGTIGTLANRIDEFAGGVPVAADLQATANIFNAKIDQWVMLAAIFASIGMLIHERTTGTLAWTLSKPVSRTAVLLAKWTAAVVMLAVFAVVLPLAWMVGVATVAYGSMPDVTAVARFGAALIALPAFFVALNLALATRLNSQAAIAAIALGVAFAPYLLVAFVPAAAELWPSAMAVVAAAFGVGDPVNTPTIACWAISVLALGILGLWAFNREDM